MPLRVPPLLRHTRTRLPGCTRCPLAETRTQVVFGSGDPDAELMLVGEAPGFHEDQRGLPFAGQAGELLERLLAGIGLDRRDVYLANVLKCRPPQNRDPLDGEIAACEPHLFRQIELVRPRVVATLGNFATKLLSGRSFGITRVHGQEHEVTLGGTTVILYPLYHPAAALYTPSMLRALEDDFARIPALLGAPSAAAAAARCRRAGAPAAPTRRRAGLDRGGGSTRCSSASSEPVLERTTASALETEAFGALLAALLRPGDVVLVRGELGAGKTTLVRGACRSLGIEGAGDEPDVHDRPSVRGRRRRSLTSTSTGSSGSARRVGRPRAVFRRHHRLRRVARCRSCVAPAGACLDRARARLARRAAARRSTPPTERC